MTEQVKPVVLVVEDEPILRMMALDLVDDAGLEAVEAASAVEAARILENRPDIRLVFTDIDMPDRDDVLKLAAAIPERWPRVRLIITSGKREPGIDALPERGVFFAKPYRRSEVVTAIRSLAAG